jgi:hypothetical protein
VPGCSSKACKGSDTAYFVDLVMWINIMDFFCYSFFFKLLIVNDILCCVIIWVLFDESWLLC